jgi:hypothetical protein
MSDWAEKEKEKNLDEGTNNHHEWTMFFKLCFHF